jgi:hypothetical protein
VGAVDVSSIFGLVRGTGSFTVVLPTLVLVSRMKLAPRYRGFGHFVSAESSSRLKTMVGGVLVKVSVLIVGLGVSGSTIRNHRVWIVHSPITVVDVLFVDLIFIFRYF